MKIVFSCCFSHFIFMELKRIFELAKNYKMGFDVHVITAIFQETPATDLIYHYEYEGIPVTAIDKNKLPNTR